MSVGLLAAQLQYCLYVFGHLSKWFVFVLMFKFWSVGRLCNGRPTIGYNISIPATPIADSSITSPRILRILHVFSVYPLLRMPAFW